MTVERFTTKPQPLPKTDSDTVQVFKVTEVQLAVKLGNREFEVNYDHLAIPDMECWFYVSIVFPWKINTGRPDEDALITNGEEYYLVNTALYSPKRRKERIDLNQHARDLIERGIRKYIRKMEKK